MVFSPSQTLRKTCEGLIIIRIIQIDVIYITHFPTCYFGAEQLARKFGEIVQLVSLRNDELPTKLMIEKYIESELAEGRCYAQP